MSMQAIFSECGRFRSSLMESWDMDRPLAIWVLWNPSEAGAKSEGGEVMADPTWRKGRGFSDRLGYGGQIFVNCFDFVSTDPRGLKAAGYPNSPMNDGHILRACAKGDGTVICGWGALGRGLSRPAEVLKMIRAAGYRTKALGFTADGLPRHPLMLAYKTKLEDF
jgi:hypothetical protein